MRLAKTNSSRAVAVRRLCSALGITLLLTSGAVNAADGGAGEGVEPKAGAEAEAQLAEVNALLRDLSSGVGEARQVTEVHAVKLEAGTLIEIRGDGRFSHVEDFVVENPTRLVVDLPGLTSAVKEDRLEVGSLHAQTVRVGEHSDKVRIVVDAGGIQGSFEDRQVLPVEKGLMIVIGSRSGAWDPAAPIGLPAAAEAEEFVVAAALAAPVLPAKETVAAVGSDSRGRAAIPEMPVSFRASAQSEPPAAAATDAAPRPLPLAASAEPRALNLVPPATERESVQPTRRAAVDAKSTSAGTAATPAAITPSKRPARMPLVVTVYGVEYEANARRDRIVVVGERPLKFRVYEPDRETFVLSLEGAAIDPDAAVRIAPEGPGPVSLVTAFDQPDVSRPEVRVVVKRGAGLKPKISRHGASLRIDFPRGGVAAVTPPVLTIEPPALSASRIAAADSAARPQIGAMDAPAPTQIAKAPALRSEPPANATPRPAPAARAPISARSAGFPGAPAALDPPTAISILHEGGLMDGKEYVGRRISLDFKDAPIADVLRLIAEVSDLNVIAGDEVDGRVTVRLVDVPWDQALDVVLLTHGLGFVRVGNVLRIAPTTSIAEEEELRLQERRAKERLEDLMVKLQPVNYADVKKVSSMIGQLLTPRGTVNVDERTNTLIIKDIPSVIDEATALVKAVDTMTPQVMIEAKIVEASLDFSRELGSSWSFGTNPITESSLGGRDFIPFEGGNTNLFSGGGSGLLFGNPIAATTGLANMAAHVFDSKFNVELQLQAAESNGDGKVISSPRIVTLDNSEASIEQGVSIPFQTFENGDAQLEFVDAVLQLKVTPHITADQSIIMDIEVSRNAPDESVFTMTGSPAIAKNQVKTVTLVKDGQTLVLGGIYVIDKSDKQSRVPYLASIPILGAAFRSTEIGDSRKELLIFVTPRIVETQDAAS